MEGRSEESRATPTPLVAFPWGSRSTSSTRRSETASDAARLTAVVVFPTPPFWFAIARTSAMSPFTAQSVARASITRLRRRARLRSTWNTPPARGPSGGDPRSSPHLRRGVPAGRMTKGSTRSRGDAEDLVRAPARAHAIDRPPTRKSPRLRASAFVFWSGVPCSAAGSGFSLKDGEPALGAGERKPVPELPLQDQVAVPLGHGVRGSEHAEGEPAREHVRLGQREPGARLGDRTGHRRVHPGKVLAGRVPLQPDGDRARPREAQLRQHALEERHLLLHGVDQHHLQIGAGDAQG